MSGLTEFPATVDPRPSELPPDSSLDCSFVHGHAGALALGALESSEQRRIEEHLSWCPSCAAFVFETRRAVAFLPFLSPTVAPPVHAKRRLFDAIEAMQRPDIKTTVLPAPTLTIPSSADALAPVPPSWSTNAGKRAQAPSSKRRFQWEMALAPLAAVPLMLALTIVGGWALRTQDQMRDQTAEMRALQSENTELANQVAVFTSNTAANVVQRFSLVSNESMFGGGPSSNIDAVANQPMATLEVWELATTANGYDVWVEAQDGTILRVTTFQVDENGWAELDLKLRQPLENYRSVHIQPSLGSDRTVASDSLGQHDVLWVDVEGTLGARTGTEANLLGN